MVSEREFCADYIESQDGSYEREVPVGNCLLKEDESLTRGVQGLLAWSADGLLSPSHSSKEQLIECKTTPSFTGLGQLLTYSYLRKRDRDIVREWYKERGSEWEAKSEIKEFDSHVYPVSNENSRRLYRPKPQLEDIYQTLIVGELDANDTLVLTACSHFGINIEYLDAGRWRSLDLDLFNTEPDVEKPPLKNWLKSTTRETLDSPDEEDLAKGFCETLVDQMWFKDIQTFREIPIGSHLYSSPSSAVRADLVIKADGYWLIVEVKRSSSNQTSRPFQKAFGQAAGYAALFSKEWELPQNQVIPVVVQQPVAVIGDLYRRDRYDENYRRMFQCGQRDMTQPVIFGPSGAFGAQ